jgi:hypothetical protein
VFSVPVVSVSMSVVLRGAKKLQVNSAFGDILTAAAVDSQIVQSSQANCCWAWPTQ